MVFFTCAHCGEAVKKPKVEKHYSAVCKGKPISVTCVDCCKDFSAETYPAHTTCVTEEEKYSAKGFQPKTSTVKGEQKRKEWLAVIENVRNVLGKNCTNKERLIMDTLSKHVNVPRKLVKFQNFLKNILGKQYDEKAVNNIFHKLNALNKSESGKPVDSKQEEEKENTSMEMKEQNKLGKKRGNKRRKENHEAELEKFGSNEDDGGSKRKKKKKSNMAENVGNKIDKEETGNTSMKMVKGTGMKKKKLNQRQRKARRKRREAELKAVENDVKMSEVNGIEKKKENIMAVENDVKMSEVNEIEKKKENIMKKKENIMKKKRKHAEEKEVPEKVDGSKSKKSKKKHKLVNKTKVVVEKTKKDKLSNNTKVVAEKMKKRKKQKMQKV